MSTPVLDDGLEVTFRRIVIGARLVGVGWFATLGVLAIAQEGERIARPGWVVVPVLAAVAWGLVSLLAWRASAETALTRLSITIDVVLASTALIAPTQAGIPIVLFYGGYPLIVVAIAAVRSRGATWVSAGALVVVVLARAGVEDLGDVVGSVSQIVTYVAGALIFTWVVRVLRTSETERRIAEANAARASERAEISRHLHDSVLQTLALVQRAADRPDEVVSLVRKQERELREWLYGTPRPPDSGFADAIRATAAEIEDGYRVVVDVVTVGDAPVSTTVEALVAAGREAMVNAAKHAEVDTVSVYAESNGPHVSLFVRDRGQGFDPDAVPEGRFGIEESIRRRLGGVGGTAELRTGPGRGTEWRLEVPL